MMKYINLYRLILRTFGFHLRPVGTFCLLQIHRLINGATRALDHLFFPEFRRQPLDRPIFILGNPRGGTTFVHRFLLNTDRLCAFELWEMLFPAITARKIFGRFIHRFAPLSPARYHSSDAHETGLRDVETDDAMAFFHFVDGGFLWSYFLAWEDTWGSRLSRDYFELDDEPEERKQRLFRYLEGCWRRNLMAKSKSRIIVKSSIFTLRVKTLLKRYPDCKIIYCVRDPLETIPSGMSLLTGVLEQSYDMFHSTSPDVRQRYLENLYQGSCAMYRTFHDLLQSGVIPERNLKIVPYPRLMNDLERTMAELVDFLEIEPSARFTEKLLEQAEKQRHHKSRHEYSLAKFGLDEARLRRDLAFVYQTYGLAGGSES
ncbi:MAG: sulfotransferase [Myxococcales bacterium]|nr:sulfotransferase [Myxococcales bacterium]